MALLSPGLPSTFDGDSRVIYDGRFAVMSIKALGQFSLVEIWLRHVDGLGRREAARGQLIVCSVAGPGVGVPSEPVVIVGNPEHDCLSRALFRRSSKGTHFLTPLPPMIWVISQ